jgi:hypothetical protein
MPLVVLKPPALGRGSFGWLLGRTLAETTSQPNGPRPKAGGFQRDDLLVR